MTVRAVDSFQVATTARHAMERRHLRLTTAVRLDACIELCAVRRAASDAKHNGSRVRTCRKGTRSGRQLEVERGDCNSKSRIAHSGHYNGPALTLLVPGSLHQGQQPTHAHGTTGMVICSRWQWAYRGSCMELQSSCT
eukprot:jgi/Ulvmu1/6279/UM028_0139.1